MLQGLQTSPYWTGMFTIKCGIRYDWMAITLLYHGVLSFTCLVIQARLFYFIRHCVRYAPQLERNNQQESPIFNLNTASEEDVNSRRQRMNRMEVRAARILGLGILPFCVVSLTLCVGSFVLIGLRSKGIEGYWMKNVILIFREVILIHLIYIPTVFITQSREFRLAVKRFCRWQRRSQSIDQFG